MKYLLAFTVKNMLTLEREEHLCIEKECSSREEAHDFIEEYSAKLPAHCEGNYRLTPVVVCCGEDLLCTSFTNTCSVCGADYNFAGSRLASRSQWGEETGEHWSECY